MASQALYRRYRSQTFDELIGQEHIVQTLRNALAEGRIAHAYLFTGPRGVGKTTVARLLAKAVNCTAEQSQRPCGECESCVSIAEGRSVDVIEMDAASHTSVEDAREIIERVQFRPTHGAYKVYIIDETHMLSTAAFNALLKTLEEPPGHALFILATTESHKIPATILSRCQRFTFSRHTISSTAGHLRNIAQAENFTLEPGVPEAIARAATGSMRDALSILDQLMAYGGNTITLEQVRGLLGATESQEVSKLITALQQNDLTSALRVVAAVADQGADLRQFARDLVERLRSLMLLKAGGDTSLLDLSEDELATMHQQAAAIDLGALLNWLKLFSGLDHQLRTSPYGQLPLELAIVEALAAPAPVAAAPSFGARPAPSRPAPASAPSRPAPAPTRAAPPAPASVPPTSVPPAAPVAAPSAPAEPALAHAAQAAPRVAPSAPAAAQPTVSSEGVASANAAIAALEHVEQIWPDLIQGVRARDKTLYALLNSGVRPIDVEDHTIVLEVKTDFLQKRLEQMTARHTIEVVLSKLMGTNYSIRSIVETQHREDPNALREQIRKTRKDQHVKAALNIFDAEIIAVETDQ